LKEADDLEKIVGARVTRGSQHPHQAFGRDVSGLGEFGEADSGVDVIAQDDLGRGDIAGIDSTPSPFGGGVGRFDPNFGLAGIDSPLTLDHVEREFLEFAESSPLMLVPHDDPFLFEEIIQGSTPMRIPGSGRIAVTFTRFGLFGHGFGHEG
jgi:hypothetical protein